MIVATFMVVIVVACLGFISVVSYETNTEDARDDRGNEADDGPDDGNDRSRKRR